MAPKKSKGFGERHEKIMRELEKFIEANGYPPSIRELGIRIGITSTSLVNYYLDQLVEWKYIQRDDNKSRGVRLIKRLAENAAHTIGEILQIPIQGKIFASIPVPVASSDFAYYDPESMVSVARSLIPSRDEKDLFALEVKGDSMMDAMISDGDIVIMKKATEANNGEMVAVWLLDREETTLKYFYKEKNRIRLQPAHPDMDPIIINDPKIVQIQGKVLMVIRQVDRVN